MTHARHQAAFFDHAVGVESIDGFGNQLQGDVAIQLRIPGAIDGAVRAAADDLAQGEVGPAVGNLERLAVGAIGGGVDGRAVA